MTAKTAPSGEALGMVETRGFVGMIEAIDAICNRRLERIRKSQIFKIHEPRIYLAFLILDHQSPRIAQGIRQFLGKKRMSFRLFPDQSSDHGWNRLDTQALAD